MTTTYIMNSQKLLRREENRWIVSGCMELGTVYTVPWPWSKSKKAEWRWVRS